MTELEKKLMLTQEEFEVLLSHFGQDKSFTSHINYYFDTEDRLMNRNGITCRIRYKNGKYIATMKSHNHISDDCSMETDMYAGSGPNDNCFIDMGLKFQGTLTTYRTVLIKNDSYEMVLDRNEYLGNTDYELEIEYKRGNERNVENLFRWVIEILIGNCKETTLKTVVANLKHTKSKSQRFFERKNILENLKIQI